jgi:peptidyl-prolyl cis-trans isomerase B (cyclophilin B)
MVQGGDPNGTAPADPRRTIPAEFTHQEARRRHPPMARTSDPEQRRSQFFIMVAPSTHLDGQYSIFGEVVEGLDVVNKIVNTPRDRSDKPLERVDMIEVTVAY